MLLVRLTLWAMAVVIVAASLAVVPVWVYVLFTEGGPLGGAIVVTAIAVALGVGGPYVGYLLVRTARRLRLRRPPSFAQEVRGTAVWLVIMFGAALGTPLPGNPPLGARLIIGVICGMAGLIGLADALERERPKHARQADCD